MGNIDSLTELANILDIFFKGLSECNLLTTYSLQLQAAAVDSPSLDSPLQTKFQFLVHQFMKNIQGLLIKIPKVPGQEMGCDIGTQTSDQPDYIELKILNADEPQSLVECVLDPESWEDHKQNGTEADEETSFVNCTTDIIVTCDPESLAAMTGQSFTATEDPIGVTSPVELIDEDPLSLESSGYIESEGAMHLVVSSADSEESQNQGVIFICESCDMMFSSARSLSQHLSAKHHTKGQCDMCSQKFSSVQSLQEHCRSEHGGSGCFTCSLCGRRFMTKLSYCRHMDTHNGKKGAVCDMCGKMFSRADYLQKHYMTHTGTRPHACTLCSRRFVSSSQLRVHALTHSGLKEHICDVCQKAFSRIDKLKDHMLRHLSIKRFECLLCSRSYAEKRDLTKHHRVHESSKS